MIFDISTKQNAMKFLCEFTGLSNHVIDEFLGINTKIDRICTDTTAVTAHNLSLYGHIDFSVLDTTEIKAYAKHYTSNNDDCKSIRNMGLVDLQTAVDSDTPLRRFLNENQISISPNKNLLLFEDKEFDITYTSYDSSNPLTHIGRKIYYDNQISCFFRIVDISDYGGHVDKRPEILYNLDTMFKGLNLSHKWAKQSESYEISFCAPLSAFELFTFYEKSECPYYNNANIAKSLIDLALSVVSAFEKDEIFAYVKPTTIILPEQIISIQKI